MLAVSLELQAQPLSIKSSDPVDHATAVPLDKVVRFHFNEPLPYFGTDFITKFHWSPSDSTNLGLHGHDLGDGTSKIYQVFFTLEHTRETDFSFIVYGVRADDGRTMERPFVLNYTTAATNGTNRVSGVISESERPKTFTTSAKRDRLRQYVRRFATPRQVEMTTVEASYAAGEPMQDTRIVGAAEHETVTAVTAAEIEMRRTAVALLEDYALTIGQWRMKKAAVPDLAGAFVFENVRDGVYWPVALNFADDEGSTIGVYGFYDPDGDYEPDSIVVSGSDLNGIDLSLFSFEPITAGSDLELAIEAADKYATDQQLIQIQALPGPASTVFDGGTSYLWRYTFYSPSQHVSTHVVLDPVSLQVQVRPDTSEAHPIPQAFIDSDEALSIAEANGGADFRAAYEPDGAFIQMSAGDLPLVFRPLGPNPFWAVTYLSPAGFPFESLRIFIDMETGEVLEGVKVDSEEEEEVPVRFTLDQNYPNPFNPATSISFTLDRAADVRLAVFDVLGREITVLVDEFMGAGRYSVRWNAGSAASGTYVCRLEAGGQVQTRLMTLVR